MNGMTRWMSGWEVAGLAVAASAGWARGQMTYLTQQRQVSATTQSGTNSDAFGGLGPWSAGVGSSYPFGSAFASASQTSNLRSDAVEFNVAGDAANHNAFTANSVSSIVVTFSLDVPTQYDMIMVNSNVGSTGILRLTLNGADVFYFYPTNRPPVSTSGVLQAGTYQLTVSASGFSTQGVDGGGSVNGTLYIPTPTATAALFLGLSLASARRRRS